jgi:hypothetical protein
MAPSIETLSPAPVPTPLFDTSTKHIPETSLPAPQTKIPNGKVYVEELLTKSEENFDAHSVPFNPQYAMNPRKLKIITIGAGFSGLLIAHKFQHRFPELQDFVEHTIFEARSDIGGTWLVNTYPGVQCDVPAHIYVWLYLPSIIHELNVANRF